MELPIDTAKMSFICAAEPVEVLDYETRRPKTNADGVPLYQVRMLVMANGRADVIGLKVPGQPTGITQGQPVRLEGMIAIPWTNGDAPVSATGPTASAPPPRSPPTAAGREVPSRDLPALVHHQGRASPGGGGRHR